MSEELEQAIRVIQERNNLEPTGKLDEATRNKIQEEHGS
jgi:peptidoglycan hydrolase-like protein with peptidoglycan-binding domain